VINRIGRLVSGETLAVLVDLLTRLVRRLPVHDFELSLDAEPEFCI